MSIDARHNRGSSRVATDRMQTSRWLFALVLAAAAALAQAHDYTLGALHIAHPWARATAQGQRVGGAYFEIDNRGPADRLLAVRGEVSEAQQLHSMALNDNVMRMREVDAIDVPAGGKVRLEPGGLHIMLVGLKAPLAAGSSFPLLLKFEKAGELKVEVRVESGMPAGHDMKH
jgi:periplasmic copper chaperone A